MVSKAEEYLLAAAGALQNDDLPSAQEYIARAVLEASEWPLRGHVLHGAGVIHRRAGNFDTAVQYLQEFVREAGETGNGVRTEKVFEGWYYLGLCLRQRGEEDRSVEAYREAVKGFRTAGNTSLLFTTLLNLAWAACQRNLTDEAKAALDEAAPLAVTDDDRHHFSLSLALCHHVCGDNNAAADLVDELRTNEAVSADVRCHAAWLRAHIFLYHDDNTHALEMAQAAEDYAARTSDPVRYLADVAGLRHTLELAG